MKRIVNHARSNAIAYAALFVALGGSSYAAATINGSQIQNHTINPSKFNPRFINGSPRAWAIVRPNGTVIAAAGHPRVTQDAVLPSDYIIHWGVKVRRCTTVASIDVQASPPTERVAISGNPSVPLPAGYALASTHGGRNASTNVVTYNQAGQPTQLAFDVAVIC